MAERVARHARTTPPEPTSGREPDGTRIRDGSPGSGEDRGRDAERPTDIPARGWLDIARRVKREIGDDHVSLAAAGVAFFGFLASVPALATVVSIYGLFTDPAEVEQRVESLFGALPQEAQSLLQDQLANVVEQNSGALTGGAIIGVALSLWSASSAMGHLIEAINVAYDEDEERSWFARKGQALLFTIGAVLGVVAVGVGIGLLSWAAAQADLGGVAGWAVRLLWVPLVMAGFVAALAVLYRHGPDREHARWRWVSWGSVIAVVVWAVASVGFQIYVTNFGSYNETYGSLAAVVILLFWLYLTSFVILAGAQLNAEIEHQTARDSTTGPPRPLGARGAEVADSVGSAPADHRRP
ncbi:MAG: YihY/virulence factor BrkB family protein [Acidimicrobiales bacterium]